MEKFWEHNLDLSLLSIDFQQAFDSVSRQELDRILGELRIPPKLERLLGMTSIDTKAKAKVLNRLSPVFSFRTGVNQGDGLSAVYSAYPSTK